MKSLCLLLLFSLIVLTFADSLAVFPRRPIMGKDGHPLPSAQFIEQPRLVDGERYMPGATETIVVILAEFPADSVDDLSTPDVHDTCPAVTFGGGHNTAYYTEKIFSEVPGSNSMDQYWDECSLGQMDIEGGVFGPYTMPHSMAYYGWDTQDCGGEPLIDDGWNTDAGLTDCLKCVWGAGTGTCRLIKDAVEAADGDINYCLFNTDNDQGIDHIIVVHAGRGQELGPGQPAETIWSWFYSGLGYGPYDTLSCQDGVFAENGCIVPEYYDDPAVFPLGVFCHEFSHSIGNPDLYDADGGFADVPDENDYPVADWCLMAHGSWCGPTGMAEMPSHLLGFNKIGTGWVTPHVPKPLLETLYVDVSIHELESPGADIYRLGTGKGEYFLVENRNSSSAAACFDKYDSDWSDWTGSGGPGALDCGLVITHISALAVHDLGLKNNGACGYDYEVKDGCQCPQYPYYVWVEDPGYDDRHAADWSEWWYEWEIKAGAAYAAGDPHTAFNENFHQNNNCTRTASSMNNGGGQTGIRVNATSVCKSTMTANIRIPPWIITKIPDDPDSWKCFHQNYRSMGWTYYGPVPNLSSPYDDRMILKWSAPVETMLRSSPVVTNSKVEIAPGDTARSVVLVAASDGNVYCYSTSDGRQVWASTVAAELHSTPIVCDTVRARDGTVMELDYVFVNGENGRLHWLDLRDGSPVDYWDEPYGQPLEAAPRIALLEDQASPGTYIPLVFAGSEAAKMYGVNIDTGLHEWAFPAYAAVNSPAAVGDIIIPSEGGGLQQEMRRDVVFFGDDSGRLYCVDALGGMPVWDVDLGSGIVASPAVCDSVTQQAAGGYSDRIVVVATGDGIVYALDAASGYELWQYDTGSAGPIESSPSVAVDAVHDWGLVWFGSAEGTVYCLHLGEPPAGNRLVWSYAAAAGTGSSPGVVLPYGRLPIDFDDRGEPVFPPECATGDPEEDGVVYIGVSDGASGGQILALDAADGSLLWDCEVAGPLESSPVPLVGRVFIGGDQLYAFAPDTLAAVETAGSSRAFEMDVMPNPALHSAAIRYNVPRASKIRLRVYDARGRLVKSLFEGLRSPGVYTDIWDGTTRNGGLTSAGIYFVRLETDTRQLSKKTLLLR